MKWLVFSKQYCTWLLRFLSFVYNIPRPYTLGFGGHILHLFFNGMDRKI